MRGRGCRDCQRCARGGVRGREQGGREVGERGREGMGDGVKVIACSTENMGLKQSYDMLIQRQ